MVKLASARESRLYGPWLARHRSEYVNAGLYLFAAILLIGGFVAEAQFSAEPKTGLALLLLLIALSLIVLANVHDLIAHLASVDFRLTLMEFDVQLALVEFAVPVVQALGAILMFLSILFLLIQTEKGYGFYSRLEKHALNMLIAGPTLWLLGSIHNSCQIYERADGHVQILQESVHIPFLMGSLLFLVGGIFNSWEQARLSNHGLHLLGRSWISFGIAGAALFLVGGITNVVKVFKMQQGDGLRLEKLRGGAQERLISEREGHVSLLIEERFRKIQADETTLQPPVLTSSYKDVLVGQS